MLKTITRIAEKGQTFKIHLKGMPATAAAHYRQRRKYSKNIQNKWEKLERSSHFGKGKIIICVDTDAFFASMKQKTDPRLKDKPVAIIGSAKRTVITTASYKVRESGIQIMRNSYTLFFKNHRERGMEGILEVAE